MKSVSQDLLGMNNCSTSGIEFFLCLFVAGQHISLLIVLNSPREAVSFSVCEKPQVAGHLGFYTSEGLPANANLRLGVPNSVSFVPVGRCTNFKDRTFLSNFYRHTNFPNCQSSWLALSTNGCMMMVFRRGSLSLDFVCELYYKVHSPQFHEATLATLAVGTSQTP